MKTRASLQRCLLRFESEKQHTLQCPQPAALKCDFSLQTNRSHAHGHGPRALPESLGVRYLRRPWEFVRSRTLSSVTFANPTRTIVNCIKEEDLHEVSTLDVQRAELVWTVRSCALWLILYNWFGRTILEGTQREMLRGLPLWRYDHPGVLAACLVAGI